MGVVMVVFCFAYLVYTVIRFALNQTIQGWTSLVVLILLIGGVQLFSLGIVGQYVARIFEEAKNRPLYLIDEVVEGSELVPGGLGEQRPSVPSRK
jgi:dolichol-phosphate mannosyltransferase